VRFASGTAALDAAASRTVREAAASVMSMGTAITIAGYADASGSHAANVELAKRRAAAVRDALVANGVDPRRIRVAAPKDVTGSGTADEARRVDIRLDP
jgi:outer membrane protein OmpA-like peptidoglycan-associated protein